MYVSQLTYTYCFCSTRKWLDEDLICIEDLQSMILGWNSAMHEGEERDYSGGIVHGLFV